MITFSHPPTAQPAYQPGFASQSACAATYNESIGITEVVLPAKSNLSMALPTLAFLSQQQQSRWLTWFAPQGINKALLQQYGFALDNIRLVHTKSEEQQLWYMWEALAEGNSHTVVASPGKISDKRFGQLEHAARVGSCAGLLIRYR